MSKKTWAHAEVTIVVEGPPTQKKLEKAIKDLAACGIKINKETEGYIISVNDYTIHN